MGQAKRRGSREDRIQQSRQSDLYGYVKTLASGDTEQRTQAAAVMLQTVMLNGMFDHLVALDPDRNLQVEANRFNEIALALIAETGHTYFPHQLTKRVYFANHIDPLKRSLPKFQPKALAPAMIFNFDTQRAQKDMDIRWGTALDPNLLGTDRHNDGIRGTVSWHADDAYVELQQMPNGETVVAIKDTRQPEPCQVPEHERSLVSGIITKVFAKFIEHEHSDPYTDTDAAHELGLVTVGVERMIWPLIRGHQLTVDHIVELIEHTAPRYKKMAFASLCVMNYERVQKQPTMTMN